MSFPLALYASPIDNKNNKSIKNTNFGAPSAMNKKLTSMKNAIKSIHDNSAINDNNLAEYSQSSIKENFKSVSSDNAVSEYQYNQLDTPHMPLMPAYNPNETKYNLKKEEKQILEKLDKIIHLFEENHDTKSNQKVEELILYSFLGIFIIYVLDSFARIGKYVR